MYIATGVTELDFVEVYVVLYEADVGPLVVEALKDEILGAFVTDGLLGCAVVDVDVRWAETVILALHFDDAVLIY